MKKPKPARTTEPAALYRLPAASRLLSISGPTLKQWIYTGKIRSIRTPGGHHRIPRSEIDRLTGAGRPDARLSDRDALDAISGRNKLLGTITRVRYGGLLAEITIAVGDQSLTAIITSVSSRSLGLKAGMPAYGLVKATEVMVVRA